MEFDIRHGPLRGLSPWKASSQIRFEHILSLRYLASVTGITNMSLKRAGSKRWRYFTEVGASYAIAIVVNYNAERTGWWEIISVFWKWICIIFF